MCQSVNMDENGGVNMAGSVGVCMGVSVGKCGFNSDVNTLCPYIRNGQTTARPLLSTFRTFRALTCQY